jgi:hypothetical protein
MFACGDVTTRKCGACNEKVFLRRVTSISFCFDLDFMSFISFWCPTKSHFLRVSQVYT